MGSWNLTRIFHSTLDFPLCAIMYIDITLVRLPACIRRKVWERDALCWANNVGGTDVGRGEHWITNLRLIGYTGIR